jgi:GDP-L-fucose synthase
MIKDKFFWKKKVFVTGHNGMVGSALLKKLRKFNCKILTENKINLDLRNQKKVELWFKKNKPDYVFLLAAKVGGIYANKTYPADFIYDNIMIQTNVIKSSYNFRVKKLIFLGSSCVYPKNIKKKIVENDLMSGPLEDTNRAYAIAKISGLELIKSFKKQYRCNFISAMPCNIYGINDNFDSRNSHVFAALIKKITEAQINKKKKIIIWGNGKVKREFIFSEDVADALIFLMKKYNGEEAINIGAKNDMTVINLAKLIIKVLGYKIKIALDQNYPSGVFRKKLSTKKIENLGWKPKTDIKKGIMIVSKWYIKKYLCH